MIFGSRRHRAWILALIACAAAKALQKTTDYGPRPDFRARGETAGLPEFVRPGSAGQLASRLCGKRC